jgi:uracil-DNA glycosylase family 4
MPKDDKTNARLREERPIWPLDAPGMPPLGSDIMLAAVARGDEETSASGKGKNTTYSYGPGCDEVVKDILYNRGEFKLKVNYKADKRRLLDMVSGHRWAADPEHATTGPEPSNVMIIGKMLGEDELSWKRHLRGPTGQFLIQQAQSLGIKGIGNWYVTSVLKTEEPDESSTLKALWVNNQLHLLQQEIRLVQPDYILCLGADAIKTLLGKKFTLGKMRGRIVDYTIPMHKAHDDDEEFHTIKVMGARHPVSVLKEPSYEREFRRSLSRFHQMIQGERWDKEEDGLTRIIVKDETELKKLIKQMDAECPDKIISIDAEWDGEHPQNDGAYLRTVQLSWDFKKAAVIVVHEQGGKPGFKRNRIFRKKVKGGTRRVKRKTTKGAIPVMVKLLKNFLKDKRIAGHQFCSDMEWLYHIGLDLTDEFAAPETWEECYDTGGLDTSLMAHAANETDDFTLTGQTLQYTNAPRYDLGLEKWRTDYCKEKGLKASDLPGYGDCPDDILYPYAAYDADVTRRIAILHRESLSKDAYGNNCWEAYWVSQRAMPGVFEIDNVGILLDSARVDELTTIYMDCKQELGARIREWAKWPDLNLESRFQVAELLFGEKYNGHERNEDGSYRRLRPKGARTVAAMPILTTDKRPKPWEDVIAEGKEDDFNASTNKTSLGIMLRDGKKLKVWRKTKKHKNGTWVERDYVEQIGLIRDYRFISQILKSVLRPPNAAEEDSDELWDTDDDGHFTYAKGLPGAMCSDKRIRTFISQLKETGRWSSARPPLQNISKRREPDYKRILGDRYVAPLRSVLRADPGYLIVEADYVGAELFGMAIMAQDETMIEHARRNQLPEEHPDFYDIHSNVAVLSFGFKCEPTKAALKAIDMAHMRIVAKSVVFGIAYGRGAKAIALAAREEGVTVSVEEAQKIIDTIFTMYPKLEPFFEECRNRAVTQEQADGPAPRWVCGPFGRFRRFGATTDRKVKGDIERQAQNFPIQGMIADVVSRAVDHIYQYRVEHPELNYKMCLQIHDALVLLVPYDEVERVVNEVLPECMVNRVPIYPCSLDGMPMAGDKPYRLGIDTEIHDYWGVDMLPDECMKRKVDPKYAGWTFDKKLNGYTNFNSFPKKYWSLEKRQLVALDS